MVETRCSTAVGLTGLPLMRCLILMVGLLTRLWLGSSGSLLWCSRPCGGVRWSCWSASAVAWFGGVPVWGPSCVGSLLGCPCVVVPSWWSVCLRLLASVGRAPRVCGRGGSTCWGVPQLWCATGCRVTRPLECETYSVVCLGLRPAGALVPSCAGAAAWCSYCWGAPHRGDHMGYPSECWSW